jgi:5-methylcytosine-specific restriction endonuclease McrA
MTIEWTQKSRGAAVFTPLPRNPRRIAAVCQSGYNSDKEMPERYANIPRRDDWVRASHKSIVHRAPVACQVTGAFAMTAKDGKPCNKCGISEWGSGGDCKQCARDRASKWLRNNPEARKEYRKQNSAKAVDTTRKWREDNPEAVRANNRRWYEANKGTFRAIENRRRARIKGNGGSFTAKEWDDLVKQYGGRCLCCGRDDVKLTVDHVAPIINGGSNDIDNIQPLCGTCNSSKGTKTIDYRPKSGLERWIQRKLFG